MYINAPKRAYRSSPIPKLLVFYQSKAKGRSVQSLTLLRLHQPTHQRLPMKRSTLCFAGSRGCVGDDQQLSLALVQKNSSQTRRLNQENIALKCAALYLSKKNLLQQENVIALMPRMVYKQRDWTRYSLKVLRWSLCEVASHTHPWPWKYAVFHPKIGMFITRSFAVGPETTLLKL